MNFKDLFDGTVHEAGTSSKLNGSLAGFKTRGDLALWSDATKALGMPGMEAHAFSLLLGFGAPLLRLTGYNGVVFSLLGKTNGGKSTMAKWLMQPPSVGRRKLLCGMTRKLASGFRLEGPCTLF